MLLLLFLPGGPPPAPSLPVILPTLGGSTTSTVRGGGTISTVE